MTPAVSLTAWQLARIKCALRDHLCARAEILSACSQASRNAGSAQERIAIRESLDVLEVLHGKRARTDALRLLANEFRSLGMPRELERIVDLGRARR
jgi:hypothetical protein